MNNEPKIYIASKTKHADKWIALRATGVNIISTWIDEAGSGETVSLELLAAQCIHQSKECDAMIVYREDGDYLKGAFMEMGIAISNPLKPVVLVGPVLSPGSIFTNLPNVFAADSIEEAVAAIRKNHRPIAPAKEVEQRAKELYPVQMIEHSYGRWIDQNATARAAYIKGHQEASAMTEEAEALKSRISGVMNMGESIDDNINYAEGYNTCLEHVKEWFNRPLPTKGTEASTGQEVKVLRETMASLLNIEPYKGVAGCTYLDTNHDSLAAAYGYNHCLEYLQSLIHKALSSTLSPKVNEETKLTDTEGSKGIGC